MSEGKQEARTGDWVDRFEETVGIWLKPKLSLEELQKLGNFIHYEIMSRTRQANQPQEVRESGWLIERGGLCLGFCEHKFAWLTFTDENALRFSRSRDAYSFMETVKWKPFNLKLEGAIVTEHIWG